MESFDRRDFAIWQGACGDAAQAPLASRDPVHGAKDQVDCNGLVLVELLVFDRLGRLQDCRVTARSKRRGPAELIETENPAITSMKAITIKMKKTWVAASRTSRNSTRKATNTNIDSM
jgi:hypothetical protein